jgi:hypothetical protein
LLRVVQSGTMIVDLFRRGEFVCCFLVGQTIIGWVLRNKTIFNTGYPNSIVEENSKKSQGYVVILEKIKAALSVV